MGTHGHLSKPAARCHPSMPLQTTLSQTARGCFHPQPVNTRIWAEHHGPNTINYNLPWTVPHCAHSHSLYPAAVNGAAEEIDKEVTSSYLLTSDIMQLPLGAIVGRCVIDQRHAIWCKSRALFILKFTRLWYYNIQELWIKVSKKGHR